ncbi:hypothetical protein Phou_025450 [Phytohabitans houttuyneae]|uniref:Polysaccharide chain length determinant N-terminal domain-containing protein n=2 Tax=Phytohabitans houttuyneae TaxID=1076126 RepID=A0A6V8KC91_9ACTN|nr:hypothetical protein Phou_025450 [Phytohabitans houttuyneae]
MLFRRWYVFAPLLVVSLLAVFLMTKNIKPDYSAVGHLQMIPPPNSTTGEGAVKKPTNPWLDLGFAALGSAVILQAQDEPVLEQLVKDGYTDSFTIAVEYGTTYFTIEAVGSTPAQATSTVQRLMKLLDEFVVAQQQQFGATRATSITTLPLDNGDKVEAITSKKKRVTIVGLGIAVMISVGLSIGLDALLRRRAKKGAKTRKPDDAGSGSGSGTGLAGSGGDSTMVISMGNGVASEPAVPRSGLGARMRQANGMGRTHQSASARSAPAEPAGKGPKVFNSTNGANGSNGSKPNGSGGELIRPDQPTHEVDSTIVLPLSQVSWRTGQEKNKGR